MKKGFVDETTIAVAGGGGGAGIVSFLRERGRPFGGTQRRRRRRRRLGLCCRRPSRQNPSSSRAAAAGGRPKRRARRRQQQARRARRRCDFARAGRHPGLRRRHRRIARRFAPPSAKNLFSPRAGAAAWAIPDSKLPPTARRASPPKASPARSAAFIWSCACWPMSGWSGCPTPENPRCCGRCRRPSPKWRRIRLPR